MGHTTDEEALEIIGGAREVIDYFGFWPSLHDAEMLELWLRRPGLCTVSFYVYERSGPDLVAEGHPWKNAILTFVLKDVFDLSLLNYSSQNVVAAVTFAPVDHGLRMEIYENTGTQGWLEAKSVSVDLMLLRS
jgi:hypothetical protein